MTLLIFLGALVLGLLVALLSVVTYSFWKKAQVETGMQIQCSSGDSEVMTFNYNFLTGETAKSKASKIAEAFQAIQERRDRNHQEYLEIKAKAMEENERKLAEEGDLKMGKLSDAAIRQAATRPRNVN